MKSIGLNSLLMCTALLLTACHPQPRFRSEAGLVFGTTYHVQYRATDDLHDAIQEAMQAVNKSLSTFDSTSVISRVNRNQEVVLDSLFTEVFQTGQTISEVTDGAFDMTVAPLVNAWGFGFDPQHERDMAMIDSIRAFVGYTKVSLQGNRVVKQDARTQLDASAIAKGYGCDRVAAALRAHGVTDFLVEIGGELVLSGSCPTGGVWRIGVNRAVDDSLQTNQEIQRVLSLTDCGVATSGNYRQFYDTPDGRVGHTMDPRTGQPAIGHVRSATVVADNCLRADAFATSFMVLGDTARIRSIAEQEALGVFLIYADAAGVHREWECDNR